LALSNLKKNCRTARGAKIALARKTFASYGDRFEVVDVNDIVTDDISDHLAGVTAVIHTAAPLSSRGDAKFLLRASILGPYISLRLTYVNELFLLTGSHRRISQYYSPG
jgi:hypothetical protein